MEITAKIKASEAIAKFEVMAEAILATLEDIKDALTSADALNLIGDDPFIDEEPEELLGFPVVYIERDKGE